MIEELVQVLNLLKQSIVEDISEWGRYALGHHFIRHYFCAIRYVLLGNTIKSVVNQYDVEVKHPELEDGRGVLNAADHNRGQIHQNFASGRSERVFGII